MRERFWGSAARLRSWHPAQGRALARVLAGAALLALAPWPCGCGDDAAAPVQHAKDAGSPDASAASGGKAGGAASAGAGSTFPGFPMPELLVVQCGTAMCVSPAGGFGFITACCASEGTSTCGTTAPSGECVKPSAGDPRCPALNFRGLISVPSCCTEMGQCGLDGTMFAMPGCRDLASASAQASAMFAIGVSIPEPRPCDPVSAAHADAGSEDAGL